jgi:hypothetical protein
VSTTTMRSYRPWERWEIYSSAMGGLSCEILGDACSSTWQQQSIEYRAALWHPQRHTESGGAASQGESAAHWAAWSRRAVERLRRLSRLSFIGPCMTVWCLRTLVNFALSGLALPLVCARLRLVSDLNCHQE